MFEDQMKPGYKLITPTGDPEPDGQGGYTTGEEDTFFNGAIRMLNASERSQNGRKSLIASHRIYAKPGLDITEDSQIAFEGLVYEVVFWNDVMRAGELLQIDVVLHE